MPELPEVETVKETLKKVLIGKKIINIVVNYDKIIEYPTSDLFIKQIINETIIDIKRRGKWLLFELNNYYLLSHLRMEGKYFYKNVNDEHAKHEHIIFKFSDNTELRYLDSRKFGRMHLVSKDNVFNQKPLNKLGLEPWDKALSSSYLKKKYENIKLPIKSVMLDQNIIVGIGNIYADEILYLSCINPLKKALQLNIKELENIIINTKEVLERAILNGGTTIRSYESSEGVHGNFQQHLLVHNKENEECDRCHYKIIKTRIGGRSTYYCPNCQKF